jgi:hypothetical protein
MVKLVFTTFIIFLLTAAYGQIKPKGTFIGLERIKGYSDRARSRYKWYHLSELTFRADSVFLEQSPVSIYKSDTSFSASDGGFYSYSGTLANNKGKTVASLTLISCDYCPMQMVRFKPLKIIDDYDTTTAIGVDTTSNVGEPKEIENPKVKYKSLFIEKAINSSMILVDGNIYRRQRK